MRARDIIISWLCVRNECSERTANRFLLIISVSGVQRGARRLPRRQFCSPVSASVEGTRKREFLGARLKGTTEGEPLLYCITFVVVFVFVY